MSKFRPDQTLSEGVHARVSDTSTDFLRSGPVRSGQVRIRIVEFGTGPTRICRWSGLVVSFLNSTTRTHVPCLAVRDLDYLGHYKKKTLID